MDKVIIEVGSTCTKVDLFDGEEIGAKNIIPTDISMVHGLLNK